MERCMLRNVVKGMCFLAGHLIEAEELMMVNQGSSKPVQMVPIDRPSGQNDVGIVAWLLTLKTPECPQGRQACSEDQVAPYTTQEPSEGLMYSVQAAVRVVVVLSIGMAEWVGR